MSAHLSGTRLRVLADRLAERLAFLAGHASTSALMAALGCDEATAVRVRLCRYPRNAGDLQQIAERFGLAVDTLATVLAGSLSGAGRAARCQQPGSLGCGRPADRAGDWAGPFEK